MRIRKNGRMPSRSRVTWLGTVQKRPFILEENSALTDGCPTAEIVKRLRRRGTAETHGRRANARRLSELREVIGQWAADLAGEDFGKRRDGSRRFIKGNTFDAGHGKEQCGKSRTFALGAVDLVDEMIERVQVDAPHRDAGRVDAEQFAPELLLGRVQADDDDRVGFHGAPLKRSASLLRA